MENLQQIFKIKFKNANNEKYKRVLFWFALGKNKI